VLKGLKCQLEAEGITICAKAGNRAEALAAVEALHPNVALVDLSLGEEDGISLIAAWASTLSRQSLTPYTLMNGM